MLLKLSFLFLGLLLNACTAYDIYNVDKYLQLEDKTLVQKAALRDGCRSALMYETAIQSMIRYNSPYYMNPELVNNSEYRRLWKDALNFCDIRFRRQLNSEYIWNKRMYNMGVTGNYVCLKSSC
jgi:hypothetical protein